MENTWFHERLPSEDNNHKCSIKDAIPITTSFMHYMKLLKKKILWSLFMEAVQLTQDYRTTRRRQFI